MKQNDVKKALEKFSKGVIKQARANLTRGNKNVSKKGYESLGYDLKVSKNSFDLDMLMEKHMQFQDLGVKGKTHTYSSARNSPFSYKSKRPPSDDFLPWIKARGIKGRDLSERKTRGQFITNKTLSFLIARSIYHKGIKGSMFFTKPFNSEFNKLPDELIEAFGLDVDSFLTFTTQ